MKRLSVLFQIVQLLGIRWAFFRLRYALRLKLGFMRRRAPLGSWRSDAPSFSNQLISSQGSIADYQVLMARHRDARQMVLQEANAICQGSFCFYGAFEKKLSLPPNWHANPLSGEEVSSALHWSQLGDFDFGDIKHIWELSRFPFVFPLLRAYALSGDESYPETFWILFDDWMEANPPNYGVNWKCGQEAAIRAMASTFALSGFAASPSSTPERKAACRELLLVTARRISVNLDYAISQNNNHGVTESVVLWVIGVLFQELPEATKWRKEGLRWMEHQAVTLIDSTGAFSQHSLNYHRVMLDAYTWAHAVASANNLTLPLRIISQCARASTYLRSYVQSQSGEVPIFGANDGAHILPLQGGGYLDFRGCLQSSSVAFHNEFALSSGAWDERQYWLGLDCKSVVSAAEWTPQSTSDHIILSRKNFLVYFRVAESWTFRPSHLDQLHLDVFYQGLPVIGDSGSFSYNAPEWSSRFPSTSFHNTACFDGVEQMSRLSRFLVGPWRKAIRLTSSNNSAIASFQSPSGSVHTREVSLATSGRVIIKDSMNGDFREAQIYWHFPSTQWREHANRLHKDNLSFDSSSGSLAHLDKSMYAPFYGAKEECLALTITLLDSDTSVLETVIAVS